jgi:hypothetical protein
MSTSFWSTGKEQDNKLPRKPPLCEPREMTAHASCRPAKLAIIIKSYEDDKREKAGDLILSY